METFTTENFTELAVASADAGTFYIDIQTDSIVYSPSLARIMTGTGRMGLTRQDLIEHVHPDDRLARDKAYAEAEIDGHLDYEVRFIWDDDTIHWARVVGRYLFNAHGERVGFSGIALDTSAEKSMRNEQ